MQKFSPGQRWISDAELKMGLGTVLNCDQRSVTVVFLATGETRIYSTATAPLRRVAFGPGDKVKSHEGWNLFIESVTETDDGLLIYRGKKEDGTPTEFDEGHLDNFMQLNRPVERLLGSQFDANKRFLLRSRTLQQANRLAASSLNGLTGGRTSLIPHQLYIAHEVARRYAPRVLLADEVGLGKTIEAGMVIHQQLLTELAQRVLIVVPDSLVHQWLVEMLRRFNLQFSIFNQQRCEGLEPDENPFESEQLVLCSLDFLSHHPKYHQQLLAAEWDLLVVDEAHHLHWDAQAPSAEYLLVEQLAEKIRGVLLLTATPEQLGKSGHFARLRLLDPERYPSFEAFVEQEQHYAPIALAVEQLLGDEALSDTTFKLLQHTLGEGDNAALLDQLLHSDEAHQQVARQELVDHLLDRHGTGRVLFRNTRAAIKGFPGREMHSYSLPLPAAYAEVMEQYKSQDLTNPQWLLSPELLYLEQAAEEAPFWTGIDPRVEWLGEQLKALRPAKVLVITSGSESAMDLAHALQVNTGIQAAVFHEGMSIVERDRAAAFFADQEYGTQVLVCSEIGSEGRNFQFAQHLILFDLPLNPDLLEQRIGRLDRIGQAGVIQLHIPYLQGSAQEIMLQWYQRGLNAFTQTCPAGNSIFEQVREPLLEALHQLENDAQQLEALLVTTYQLYQQKNQQLQQGRDRLLEYNSCRPLQAATLCRQALSEERSDELSDYLEHVFDCYGVDMEEHIGHSYVIRQGSKMQQSFPCLLEDGMTITFDRDEALANEDMHYLTWEHPMVRGAMEMVLGSEQGNSSIIAISVEGIKPGLLLLEGLYVLDNGAGSELRLNRYLPVTTIRSVVDQQGNDCSHIVTEALIAENSSKVDKAVAGKIVRAYADPLRQMIDAADMLAKDQAPRLLKQAHQKARVMLEREINRLQALRQVNPNVRDEEIQFFADQWKQLDAVIESSIPRLDAIRVVITT